MKTELAIGIKWPQLGSAVTIAEQGQHRVQRKTRIQPQRDQSAVLKAAPGNCSIHTMECQWAANRNKLSIPVVTMKNSMEVPQKIKNRTTK